MKNFKMNVGKVYHVSMYATWFWTMVTQKGYDLVVCDQYMNF